MPGAITGLYVITPLSPPSIDALHQSAAAALRGGARVLQYRDKSQDASWRKRAAEGLMALCRAHGVSFIVNDDVALAAAIQADGVHVGQDDAGVAAARAQLGPEAIIGASCYNSLERAAAAVNAGADYVAFGSVFPSSTKPQAVSAPLSLFAAARGFTDRSLVAIGGITAANAGVVRAAGADAVAVIDSVFSAQNIESAAVDIAKQVNGIRDTEAS